MFRLDSRQHERRLIGHDLQAYSPADWCGIVDSNIVSNADNVTANGVTISSDAQITLTDLGATILPDGTSFTLIDNTSGAAIGGIFSNLEDSAMIAIGSNTYEANYEGGAGNDLTLTVVP